MARILVPHYSEWYEEMAVVSCYYESEYEAKFKQHVGTVFPDFYVLTIKDTIPSKGRKPRRPDLVLIKRDLTEWWLVEVELEHHSLSHVLEQVRVFVNPDFNYLLFGRKIKERFDEEYPEFSVLHTIQQFQEMVIDAALNVLVVVDEHMPKWEKSLAREGAKLCIFQVFKSTTSTEAYRISGIYPKTLRKMTHCSSYARNPNTYEIFEPDSLNIEIGQSIEVEYNSRIIRFDIEEYNGKIVMKFNGKFNPVPTQKDYVLYSDIESKFVLKSN